VTALSSRRISVTVPLKSLASAQVSHAAIAGASRHASA